MNNWMLSGLVKAIEELNLTLDTQDGVFKIILDASLKSAIANVQVGDEIALRGKLEVSKGIKLIADKIIGFKRG